VEAAIVAVKSGATEIDVATEAEYAMRKAGAMRYGSSTFVDSGPHSIYLHGGTTKRKLEDGDLVVIDVHPVVDMYSSDCARTVVCGQPSQSQKELIATYTGIQRAIVQNIKPGWLVGQITNPSRKPSPPKGTATSGFQDQYTV
jgi:Xaa-Pro dipeptidase